MTNWIMKTGILLFAVSTIPLAAIAAPSEGEQSILVGQETRWFVVEKPKSVKSDAPLIILLHGGLSNMHKALERPNGRDWRRLAARHGFVLIAPNGTNSKTDDPKGKRQHWNDYRDPAGAQIAAADDVHFIVELVDWAVKIHSIDPDQVYITGASNGGMMTYRVLQEYPDMFAGGAAFIANLPEKTPRIDIKTSTPIILFNGTDDPLTNWNGGMVGARGQKDVVLSVPETRSYWIRKNGASAQPSGTVSLPDTAPRDKCKLSFMDHDARPGGADVRIVTMHGGGHAQPSQLHRKRQKRWVKKLFGNLCRDANGAEMAWEFFTNR